MKFIKKKQKKSLCKMYTYVNCKLNVFLKSVGQTYKTDLQTKWFVYQLIFYGIVKKPMYICFVCIKYHICFTSEKLEYRSLQNS